MLEVTLRTGAAGSLIGTTEQLVEGIRGARGVNAQQIALLMRAVAACRSADLVADEEYKQFAVEGSLLHHLYQAFSEGHAEAVARCAFAYLQSLPDAREPDQATGNSQAGHERLREFLRNPDGIPGTLDEFVAIAGQEGGLQELARILDAEPPAPTLLNEAFHDLMESDPAAKDPEFIKEHWDKIWSSLDAGDGEPTDAFQEFVGDLPSLADLLATIVAGQFEPEDAALYVAILRAGGDAGLSRWSATGLQSVGEELWAESLNENGALVSLLLELTRRGETVDVGTAYLDGLASHAQSTVHSEDDNGIGESLPDLIALLSEGNRDLLTRRVYEDLEEAGAEATQLFFELYGGLVAEGDFLLNQPGFVDRVCRPLFVQTNTHGLHWLADVFRAEPDLLNGHSDQSAVVDFRDRVRRVLAVPDEDDAVSEAVRAVADALGIEPDPQGQPDKSESGVDHADPAESTPAE